MKNAGPALEMFTCLLCLLIVALIGFGSTNKIPSACIRIDFTRQSFSSYAVSPDPIGVSKDLGVEEIPVSALGDHDLLEYRVWMAPEWGAEPVNGSLPYYAAFVQYESAAEFANRTRGSHPPVAVVRLKQSPIYAIMDVGSIK